MIKAYTITPSETEPNVVEIHDTTPGKLERMPTKAEAATMLDLLILKGAAKGAA